jgi:V/A-type H+-transporting ATPase subunit D
MAPILEGIKPTRMELLKLKKRIVLAERGHRLLKEKRDALIGEFLKIVTRVRTARKEAEEQLARAYRSLLAAQAVMGCEMLTEISWNTDQDIDLRMATRTVMGVAVPVLGTGSLERSLIDRGYGLATTSSRLDDACLMMEQA